MLDVGDRMPNVTLEDDFGRKVSTRDLLGKRHLVLYFYPKDNTPGCTNEATQFRDAETEFERAGARVVGVSRDSVAAHQRFKEKYALSFPLLSDRDSALCDAFGVIAEKTMYGRKTVGVVRSTFIIDSQGTIVRVWPKVRVDGHARDVLEAVT